MCLEFFYNAFKLVILYRTGKYKYGSKIKNSDLKKSIQLYLK